MVPKRCMHCYTACSASAKTKCGHQSLRPLLNGHAGCRQERLVAATMDGSVALLDVEAGTQLAALQPHRKYVVKALCLQAAGDTRIVTGSWVRGLGCRGCTWFASIVSHVA